MYIIYTILTYFTISLRKYLIFYMEVVNTCNLLKYLIFYMEAVNYINMLSVDFAGKLLKLLTYTEILNFIFEKKKSI